MTDIGLEKGQNQDSYLVKRAKTSLGEVAFAVLCDGMGGLEQGEVASATVIKYFDTWFESTLPNLIDFGLTGEILKQQWTNIIRKLNVIIANYGKSVNISLGTTICAFLFLQGRYYCINVGDSRAYKVTDDYIFQITKDHSLVQRKIDQGIITEAEANDDPERSVLLQCIGSSPEVYPDFFENEVSKNEIYMLCSDGFRHEISNQEIHECFLPERLTNKEDMKNSIQYLIELNKERKETDNITAVLIRTY